MCKQGMSICARPAGRSGDGSSPGLSQFNRQAGDGPSPLRNMGRSRGWAAPLLGPTLTSGGDGERQPSRFQILGDDEQGVRLRLRLGFGIRYPRIRRRVVYPTILLKYWVGTSLAVLVLGSCSKVSYQPSPEVTSLGKIEVTARLSQIIGEFPPNNLYDYVYVMKYQVLKVHRGQVEGQEIYVGHYNPLKPRAQAADKFSGKIGGNVYRFQAGDVHRLALDKPLDLFYMGGIIDKFFKEPGTRYWAIWTERSPE